MSEPEQPVLSSMGNKENWGGNMVKYRNGEVMESPLTVEQYKKFLEEARPTERRFLLVLETQQRPGDYFTEDEGYNIILGEADEIELEHYYSYSTTDMRRILIIPKTIPVVIHWWYRWDFGTNAGEKEKMYIFTSDGWKVVDIRS